MEDVGQPVMVDATVDVPLFGLGERAEAGCNSLVESTEAQKAEDDLIQAVPDALVIHLAAEAALFGFRHGASVPGEGLVDSPEG